MGSSAMINIGSDIQKLIGRFIGTQTAWKSHKLISIFFQRKEIRLEEMVINFTRTNLHTFMHKYAYTHTCTNTYTSILSRSCATYRRVLDWMIEFIEAFLTVLGTAGNYSAIADLHIYNSLLHTH
jgi:hypothetical protein